MLNDDLLIDVAEELERKLTRNQYERLLINLGLYSLSTLKDNDEYYSLTKHNLILETLRSPQNQYDIIFEIYKRHLFSKEMSARLMQAGFDFGDTEEISEQKDKAILQEIADQNTIKSSTTARGTVEPKERQRAGKTTLTKSAKNRPVWQTVLGVLTVIGIIAAIVSGLNDIFSLWDRFVVPSWGNSPEPTITSLPSPEPTTTPLPSNEPTITTSLTPTLEIFFNDDFSSKSKYPWILPNSNGGSDTNARIEQGNLMVTINCPSTNPDFFCTSYIRIPQINKTDFNISFDFLYEQLTTGTSSIIAVIFRVDPLNGNYYSAQYIFDGQCTLSEYYVGDTIGIKTKNIGLGYYPNLNTNYNYSLLVNNNRFTISIDGNVVVSEVNGDINAIGPIYLYFYVSSGGIATINIDNLLIKAP
jgi:hypothetical protein